MLLKKAREREGDYLFVETGEERDVVALTDALLFISTQKSTAFAE